MSFVLFVLVVLFGCPFGKALFLHSEKPTNDHSSSSIRTSRCQAETLQHIRKIILDSLNLQSEPQVSVSWMDQIRNHWKVALKGTSQSKPKQPNNTENTTSPEISSLGNASVLQCCTLASQIFIKDLGWDKWIIYPESFTYIQCSGCDPQSDQSIFHCRRDSPPSSQTPCCEPTAPDFVPFLYLDETSSLVIGSVPLTHECGCGPRTKTYATTP